MILNNFYNKISEITVYIDYFSQPARAVLSFVNVCKIPCIVKEIRMFRDDHLSEECKKIPTSQRVMALVHESLVLYESHPILTYLAVLFSVEDHWYPKNSQKRALIECYLHWHHFHIRRECELYLQNRCRNPLIINKSFEDLENIPVQPTNDAFVMIENILSNKVYVGRTQEMSIADITCYSEIVSLKCIDFDFSKYPYMQKWMQEVGEIKEIKEVHQVFFKLIPNPKI